MNFIKSFVICSSKKPSKSNPQKEVSRSSLSTHSQLNEQQRLKQPLTVPEKSNKNDETSTKNDKTLSTMNSGISTQEPKNQMIQDSIKEDSQEKVVLEALKYTDFIQAGGDSHLIEKKTISKIMELQNRATHCLDMDWSYDYAEYLRNGYPKPKPIDNSRLKKLFQAKKASPDEHYVIVDELIWLIIMNLHGGGPEIISLNEKDVAFHIVDIICKPRPASKTVIKLASDKNLEKPRSLTFIEKEAEKSKKLEKYEQLEKEEKIENEEKEDKHEKEVKEDKIRKNKEKEEKTTKKTNKSISSSQFVVGISNSSYYCFINTALQCLLSVQNLNEFFLQEQYSHINYKTKKSLKYTHAYHSLISEITKNSRSDYINASNFKKMFKKNFSPYEMHDSQEFLRFLLSELQDEMNPPIPLKIVKKFQLADFASVAEAWNFYQTYHPSIIDELFAGQLFSEITCPHCDKISTAYDPFLDLSLTITKSTSNIYDCLELFCKKEIVEQYQCEGCKKKSKAYKSLRISVEPRILVVHFKRFKIYPRKMKVTDRVSYPLNELRLEK